MGRAANRPLDIAVAINYYAPHISGLTRTAQAVAEACVESGLSVKVICSQHDKSLPIIEDVNGVSVERVPVLGHIENGLLSPRFPFQVARSARYARLLHLHLPMIEGAVISALTRRTPRIISYQCDFTSNSSLLRPIVNSIVDLSSQRTIRGSQRVVVSSLDYAQASRIAPSLTNAVEIFPAVSDRRGGQGSFRFGNGPHYGYLGRMAPEKGLPELIRAFELACVPESVLIIAGPTPPFADSDITTLLKEVSNRNPRIRLLGTLDESELKNFYASIDYFVLPSTNSLEAFGITQAEALVCGIPVIATSLPGARTLQQRFGNGILVPPSDVKALAEALSEIRTIDVDAKEAQTLLTGTHQYLQLVGELLGHPASRE